MAMYTNGDLIDQILSDNQALPSSATNVDSTNTISINFPTAGNVCVKVRVHTSSAFADGRTITIRPYFGTTSTPASGFKSYGVKAMVLTAATTTLVAGELIDEFIIPRELCKTYKYMKLNYAVSADLSGITVDAYTCIN